MSEENKPIAFFTDGNLEAVYSKHAKGMAVGATVVGTDVKIAPTTLSLFASTTFE